MTRKERCGLTTLPEIRSAFILPTDAAFTTVSNRAAERPRAVTAQTPCKRKLEKNVGACIMPTTGLPAKRCAPCRDLLVVFSACLEQVGRHSLVLIQDGHSYAGRLVEEIFFFSSRRRHTRFKCDWSSDVCSSD